MNFEVKTLFALPLIRFFFKILPIRFAIGTILIWAWSPSGFSQALRINEILSSNGESIKDENGDSPDWIELYNSTASPLSLKGYGLSDSRNQPFKWVFEDVSIQPNAHLLIFASGKNRQPGATAPLNPDSVAGLKVWLRADQVSTNDTSEVRRNQANYFVKFWRDGSGKGNHARQTTESFQPAFIPSSPLLEGKPVLRFDGANDLLTFSSQLAENNFCILTVVRTTLGHEVDPQTSEGVGGIAGQRYLFGAQHGGDLNGGAGISIGTNGISVYEHGAGYMPALAVYDGPVGPGFAALGVNYRDKTPTISLQGSIAQTGVTSLRRKVTAPVELGSGAYGGLNGDVAEIIIYDRSLTDVERRGVEEYLARKYNLNFPSPIHTNFSLDADGERLFLTSPDGALVDELPSVPIPRDISYGRQPDADADFYFFRQPTPGAANLTEGSKEFLADVAYSQPGGYYTNSFDLTLSHPNAAAQIRYTLDGSEPKETSTLYSVPIRIQNRTSTANKISNIPTGGGWQAPAGLVFKTTVVRARAFKAGDLPSDIATHTFLVYPTNKYTLPVISLATDQAGFFSGPTGIYVPGNTGGNFWERGDAWERAAHIEFFETDGSLAFSQDVGVKIHGNTSRQFPQKALTIRARYGNSRNPIRYQLFKDRPQKEFEKFMLRQSGHDYYLTFFRDALMQRLVEDLGVETQAYRPAILFLNGEYWGIHNVREVIDKYFIAAHGGVDSENIDYLEGYAVANEGDLTHYNDMLNFLAQNDIRAPQNYAHLQTLMEVDNYLDYKIPETFYYRWDIGNNRFWRARTPEARWRWIHFDDDVGWGGFWAVPPAWAFNMLGYVTEPNGPWTQYQGNPGGNDHNNPTVTYLLRRLLENPTFKQNFINRFADLLNTTFHPSRVTNIINEMSAVIAPEMQEHINRWRAPASMAAWRNNVQYLRDYAVNRPTYARQHLAQKFKLGANLNLSVSVSSTNLGRVKVNSIFTSSPTNTPWSGIYFKGHPITFSAIPSPGSRFVGWTGILGVKTNTMTLSLNSDLNLTAIFEAATGPSFTSITILSQGNFRIHAIGAPNTDYTLQSTSDFKTWSLEATAKTDLEGKISFDRQGAATLRFYRLLAL